MLYHFQKDAVLTIISKLEKFNGCILADSVGLGKTFTALAVIKYYENRNISVLVLCPKKLAENWATYKSNYVNNPIAGDRLRYDVLYHTDLSRERGMSGSIDLSHLNWGNYDLVVIDESHNFRNGGEVSGEDERENRYLRLLNRVIRAGVRTKVLMLSATPVNNRFIDLKNQLALAYEGDAALINEKLNTSHTIDEIFRQAQAAFNAWSKLPAEQRTTEALLKTLDFDFFEVLDSVTIARSRRHIEKYYSTAEIGKFPERLKHIFLRPNLTDLRGTINYNDKLNMHTPNLADENYTKLAALFPNAVTEAVDPVTGEVVRAIDKDVLMQEINTRVVEGREERYQFTWPDKKKAVLEANAPIRATLRPVKADSVGRDGAPGGWDSENLYIEGDNLDVLKLLRETYLGKVKMIYIEIKFPYLIQQNETQIAE